MKKFLVLLIIILCGALLFVLNPDTQDFGDYLSSQTQAAVEEGVGDNTVGKLFSGIGDALAGITADVAFTRNNYFFFSTFEASMGESKYLGIAKLFVQIKE